MSEIRTTDTVLSWDDKMDHLSARLGIKRSFHRVEPGLYRIGNADQRSPVFVTANYTLSFDSLRSNLGGIDAHILVLDTKGINVWCAAGKGTFGTDELVERIKATDLASVVSHRELILPQLGAPGISAHEVEERSGFAVRYGPVRSSDIQEFMRTGQVTKEMRRVTFPVKDRAILIPVELKNYLLFGIVIGVLGFLIAGTFGVQVVLATYVGGLTLFPLLFPYLPTKDFTSKGLILGALLSIPVMAHTWTYWTDMELWQLAIYDVALALMVMAAVGYLALNFTGSTPYPSRTGVRREIFRYIPVLASMMVIGILMNVILTVGIWETWF